jgi:uncharacterized protein involved in exopolysaccharide biosynthesis
MENRVQKKVSNSIIELDDLKSVLRIAVQNWYIVVALLLVSYIASFVFTYKLTNVFGAQTQLLLESNDQVNEQSIINENFGSYYNWYGNANDNTTEMRVVQSFDLIKKAGRAHEFRCVLLYCWTN